jgi:hypothetical protein
VKRILLFAFALALAASCAPGFEPASRINGLRILALTADRPYAKPGEEVTLAMTVYDGFGDEGPRPLQIMWLAGCYDPEGDQYFLCFEQLVEVLKPLADGGELPEELVKFETSLASASGSPNAHTFRFRLPLDIVSRRPKPPVGPHYGIVYVFYAACAGTLAPADFQQLGSAVPEFPLRCLDNNGVALGPESFVPGYTQVYAFADERQNAVPEVRELRLDALELSSDPSQAPTIPRCPIGEAERRQVGCNTSIPDDVCPRYRLNAAVTDQAEPMPDGANMDNTPIKETVWISYFSDGGDIASGIRLVNDAVDGYQPDHSAEFIAPPETGLVTFWAVVRDQRGGSSVVRRYLRVD